MKIQYMSDLHLELSDNSRFVKHKDFPVMGNVLVLAGDIFYLRNEFPPLSDFWDWASKAFKQVLIVPGNHDYYGHYDVMERGMSWQWMIRENVGYYQNQVVRIEDTDFILSTFWSHITPLDEYYVARGLNDFRQTEYNGHQLTTDDYNQMHQYCLDFVKGSVSKSNAKHIVVVTHHLPTTLVVAPHHKGSPLNSAFATEYGDWIADSNIDAWIYGHSHTNIEAQIGKTRIVCNQLGYVAYGENEHFDDGKHIEI